MPSPKVQALLDSNPLIHGTQSTTLAQLPNTRYHFVGLRKMIYHFHQAPLAGEVIGGGFGDMFQHSATAFGRIGGYQIASDTYQLEMILKSYADARPRTDLGEEQLVDLVKKNKSFLAESGYKRINLFMFYLALAKEQNVSNDKLFTPQELMDFKENLQLATQVYFMLSMVNKYFTPARKQDPYASGFADAFTFEALLARMKAVNLDCKAIALKKKPTKAELQKVLDVLNPDPSQPAFKIGKASFRRGSDMSAFRRFAHEPVSEYLSKYFAWGHYAKVANDFSKVFLKAAKRLAKAMDAVEAIMQQPEREFIAEIDRDLVDAPFPVVLLYGRDKSIFLMDEMAFEYRCNKPILLGRDVTALATDTEEHKQRLEQYARDHGLALEVVTFDDLRAVRERLNETWKANELALGQQGIWLGVEQTLTFKQKAKNLFSKAVAKLKSIFCCNKSQATEPVVQDPQLTTSVKQLAKLGPAVVRARTVEPVEAAAEAPPVQEEAPIQQVPATAERRLTA